MVWLYLEMGLFFAGVLLVFVAMTLPGVHAAYHRSDDPALRQRWWKRRLMLSLALAGAWTLLLAWLTWSYVSWPNRNVFGAVVQLLTLTGLIYHYQYGGYCWRTKSLPERIWPMRVIALTMGPMFGGVLVMSQIGIAQAWFEDRQQSLVDTLNKDEDRCAAFQQYLTDHPQDPDETPDLYHGAIENAYGGVPQFVLAYRARTEMERLVVFYYSGSRKWTTTFRDNRDGMQRLRDTIVPLSRCDGPSEPIVKRLRLEGDS